MTVYQKLSEKYNTYINGETREQIRNDMNAKIIPVKVPIKTIDIHRYLAVNRLWAGIATSNTNAAIEARHALEVFPEFDIRVPENEAALIAILDALVAEVQAVDFLDEHKNAILSLGSKLESWADQNWPGDVTDDDLMVVEGG